MRAKLTFTPEKLQDLLWGMYGNSTLVDALRRAVDWNDAWGCDDSLLWQLAYAERLAPPLRVPAADRYRSRGLLELAADIESDQRAALHDKHVTQGRVLVERLYGRFAFSPGIDLHDELAHAMGRVVIEALSNEEPDVYAQAAAASVLAAAPAQSSAGI